MARLICPGCGTALETDPERWFFRCSSCRKLIRCRAASSSENTRVYEIEIVGRPQTRRRVEMPWTGSQQAQLERRLVGFSLATVSLVILLYLAARWWTP